MDFDDFWAIYPVHRAKKDARKAWDKLTPSEALCATIQAAIDNQAAWRHLMALQRKWTPEWPLPATWLRGERWMDEVPVWGPMLGVVEVNPTVRRERYQQGRQQGLSHEAAYMAAWKR